MKLKININFFDTLLSSSLALCLAYYIYSFLYPLFEVNFLNDFYIGPAIIDNHNKYLDFIIYFVFLFISFLLFPLISYLRIFLTNFVLKSGLKFSFAPVFSLVEKIEPFFRASGGILFKYQFLGAFGYFLLHPFDGSFYPKIFLISLVFVFVSLFDGIRRIKNKSGYSPFCLAGFMFILFFTPYNQVFAPADSHHFGERYATYFLIDKFKMRPYEDIMLVHGLTDIFPSYLGKNLFDKFTIEGFILGDIFTYNLRVIFCFILGFFIFSSAPFLTLFFFFFPFLPLCSFLLFYLFLLEKTFNKPFIFLLMFVFSSFLFSALQTTLGTFYVIASIPLAIRALYLLLKERGRSKILKLSILVLIIFLILFFTRDITSFYLLRAKEYVKGNLSAFGNGFGFYVNFFRYFIRCFALFIVPSAVLELISAFKKKEIQQCFFYVFAVIFALISINYTLVRIDYQILSRCSMVSSSFIAAFIPYFIYKKYLCGKNNRILKTFLILAFAVLVFMQTKTAVNNFIKIKRPPVEIDKDFKYAGAVKFKEGFKNKLLEEKNLIEKYIKNDGIFWDLTDSGMNYLYFDKKIPLLYVSNYNSITINQAKESLNRLKLNPPDVILLGKSPNAGDGAYPSIRHNPIYREIFLNQNYKLYTKGNLNILLRENKPYKMSGHELFILDSYFSNRNLGHMGEAWANSIKTLPLAEISPKYKVSISPKTVLIKFEKPYKGREIDFLYMEADFLKEIYNKKYDIEINGSKTTLWTDSVKGDILVPFDNFPSWLMNDNIKEIKIKIRNKGNFYKSAKVKFYKRNN